MCRLPLIFPSSSLKAYCKEGRCTEEKEEGTQREMMNCQTLLKKRRRWMRKCGVFRQKKVLPAWLERWLWTADTTLVAPPQVLAEYQGWIWLQMSPRPINLSQRQIQRHCLLWQNGCKLNPPPPPITDCERCFLIRTVNQISKNPLTVSTEGGKCQLRREWGNVEESHKGSVSTTSDSLCVCQLGHHHGEPLYPLT